MNIIEQAAAKGRTMLSEYESKRVLEAHGIPVTRETLVNNLDELATAVKEIGYPIVLKGCTQHTAHKTEKGLIKIDIRNELEAKEAFNTIMTNLDDDDKSVLVQEMVKGSRELMAGLTRDAQFGPCVMFGLGGIFAEILKDVSFRVAPIEKENALEMMKEIKAHKILSNIRGMEAADLDALAEILISLGRIGLENEEVDEIDINPLILSGGKPVAADALFVLKPA